MKNAVSLCLSQVDLAFLCNALNEATTGLREAEFEARTGESFNHAYAVYNRIDEKYQEIKQRLSFINDADGQTKLSVSLQIDDLRLVCKAIKITLDEVGERHFQTRTALTPEEARTLLNYLQARLNENLQ